MSFFIILYQFINKLVKNQQYFKFYKKEFILFMKYNIFLLYKGQKFSY